MINPMADKVKYYSHCSVAMIGKDENGKKS